MSDAVRIRQGIVEQMLAEARRMPTLECCGLLAGRDGVITTIFPVANPLASPTAFEIAPQELFEVFRKMREAGLDHLGIYHSHPATENAPSPRDIEQAYYPASAYFILSTQPGTARPVRAFRICDARVTEFRIEPVS